MLLLLQRRGRCTLLFLRRRIGLEFGREMFQLGCVEGGEEFQFPDTWWIVRTDGQEIFRNGPHLIQQKKIFWSDFLFQELFVHDDLIGIDEEDVHFFRLMQLLRKRGVDTSRYRFII